MWHYGPTFLHHPNSSAVTAASSEALEPEDDGPEVRPVITLATQILPNKSLGTGRFSRFSQWGALVKAIARRKSFARSCSRDAEGSESPSLVQALIEARLLIIQNVQYETYEEESNCLRDLRKLPSSLLKLCPVLDQDGLLRVGGRLERAGLTYEECHPLILPSTHHVAGLLIKYYHEKVHHQGRHFTLGLIRGSGFWIVGSKRAINNVINNCIKCKKLRGRQQTQKMADLPADRLTPAPPFSYVGLDVFGPWMISARRTRGGVANSKRWAVLFICLATRAIRIELIESMDTSSFINALRRFLALRGPAIQLRSDCGTNFIGAYNELQSCFKEKGDGVIQSYLAAEGCKWIFNSPHASHTGGAWERMSDQTDLRLHPYRSHS